MNSGAHLVPNGFSDSDTARKAVRKRWDKAWGARSPSQVQAKIAEFFEANDMDPAKADPNIALATIMNDPAVPSDVRVVAATKLQPYYHGPPLTEEQIDRAEGYIEQTNPEMAAKKRQAYDFVLGLIKKAAEGGETPPVPRPNAQPTPEQIDAEPVTPGDEYRPGQAPLSNDIVENE